MAHKFNPAKLAKLDNPARRRLLPPEKTLAQLGVRLGAKVADLGCGSGYFTFPLAEIVGPTGQVFGLDISEEMLAACRERWTSQHGAPENIQFQLSGERSLPLGTAQVDTVLLSTVLHEAEDPELLLREVHRILEPQGRILVIEWKKASAEMGPPVGERLSLEDAGKLLKRAGFGEFASFDISEAFYAVTARS